MFLSQLLDNPAELLRSLLIMLPGMIIALCCHESAHGYIAYRCGDPTAKLQGRITMNPVKHFDLMGFLCMLIVGFGWAKPVPVNPLNYRNYRRDDLKVSLAGITANLMLFFISFILVMGIFFAAIGTVPKYNNYLTAMRSDESVYLFESNGESLICTDELIIHEDEAFGFAMGYYYYIGRNGKLLNVEKAIIEPRFGSVVSILYEMLVMSMLVNLTLAAFNLIPLPPLDGFHVLDDLVLRLDPLTKLRFMRSSQSILLILILIGNYNANWDIISKLIGWVRGFAFDNMAVLARVIAQAIGII